MKNFITKKNAFYRLQQLFVLLAHLVLLKWMIYALKESGTLPFSAVFLHFLGMSIYGGMLIYLTAKWAKFHHEKDQDH